MILCTTSLPAVSTDPAASTMVNAPTVLAELEHTFDQYEDALIHNKVDILDSLFWNSEHTVRYGARELLLGYAQIQAFRAARPPAGLARSVLSRHVLCFNGNFGVTHITFARANEPRIGRQSQTWVRFAQGWRVVSAHVSWMDL